MVDTLVVVTRVLGNIILPDMDTDRSYLCSMFVEMDYLATKPSSRFDVLVAILSISTVFEVYLSTKGRVESI